LFTALWDLSFVYQTEENTISRVINISNIKVNNIQWNPLKYRAFVEKLSTDNQAGLTIKETINLTNVEKNHS
jgi:hypothetical protein